MEKSRVLNLRDILLIAVIGVAFGVVNSIYAAVDIAMIGAFGPLGSSITIAVFFIAPLLGCATMSISPLIGLIFIVMSLVIAPCGYLKFHLLAMALIRPDGSCSDCGYNLTGNTNGMCPECGVVL